MNLDPWITRSSRTAYENPWLRVTEHDVELPNGLTIFYGVVRLGRAVGVLPFLDDETVVMVRQWRYILDRATWEIPTGGAHADETLEEAAQRELAEETGYRATTLERLGSFVSSKSVVEETAHLFLGTGLVPDPHAQPDHTELLVVETVEWDAVLEMVLDGEIVDAMTIVAVLRADRARRLAAGR